jgi:hypothetical protein
MHGQGEQRKRRALRVRSHGQGPDAAASSSLTHPVPYQRRTELAVILVDRPLGSPAGLSAEEDRPVKSF